MEGWLAAPDQIMSANSQQPGPSDIGTPAATIPISLRILAIVLRALFIGALIAVTVRVSSPQSETLSSVYETPGDLIRLAHALERNTRRHFLQRSGFMLRVISVSIKPGAIPATRIP